MVARPWSSSRLSCGDRLLLNAPGTLGTLSRSLRERIPPLELGGGHDAPLDVGGAIELPLEWRRVCRGDRLLVPALLLSPPGGPNGKHVMSPGGLDGSREVIFTGISKLTVLLYTCCFSCQNFSLLVPSNVRVRKNFPYPSPAPPEESGISGTCPVVSHCKHPTWRCWCI